MIKPQTRAKAEQLLKEGKLSKRRICKDLSIARATLDRIENHLLFPEDYPSRNKKKPKGKATFKRCPGCGGMQDVSTPCINPACDVYRKHRQEVQTKGYNQFIEDLLGPLS